MRLCVGDDWAQRHHDVELMDEAGRRLAKARLPEGVVGMSRLHAMIAEWMADEQDQAEVVVAIETDRGPWVAALIAAGYTVLAVNPLQAARFRERLGVSGAKSDAGDAHVLADMARTHAHELRAVAGDSERAEAIKVVARAHKTMIWERTRQVQRLRYALREYFPAALDAFADLEAVDTLELLAAAPTPAAAAELSVERISAALEGAGRKNVAAKAATIQTALRAEHLGRSEGVTHAYAATVRSLVHVLRTLHEEIRTLQGQVEDHFGRHPAAEILLSQPGLGVVLGARVLAEFGDDPARYASAKARKNYAGTSPITRASGRKAVALARYVHNDRLRDALSGQAFSALVCSPGARAYYDQQKARGSSHNAALRQLANRLVGILHGCLKTHSPYNEHTAWSHHTTTPTHTAA